MKNSFKILIGIIVLGICVVIPAILFTDRKAPEVMVINENGRQQEKKGMETSGFESYSGRITAFRPVYDTQDTFMPGHFIITAEDENGQLANFLVDDRTVMVNRAEPAENAAFLGFYKKDSVNSKIEPPEYPAVAIAIDSPMEMDIIVDFFDEELISSDQKFKLMPVPQTLILDHSGEVIEWNKSGGNLLVIYEKTKGNAPILIEPDKIFIIGHLFAL